MSSSSLEVPRRQRPEKRSKLWRIVVILAEIGRGVKHRIDTVDEAVSRAEVDDVSRQLLTGVDPVDVIPRRPGFRRMVNRANFMAPFQVVEDRAPQPATSSENGYLH